MITAEEFIKSSKTSGAISAAKPLKVNGCLPVYSEDAFRLSRFIDWLAAQIGPKNTYFAQAISEGLFFKDVLPNLCSDSLFSENSLTVIHKAEKLKKGIAEELKKRSNTFNDGSLLVLVYEKAQKKGIKISALKGQHLQKWISKELKTLGLSHTGREVSLLADFFGEDLCRLHQEITKLSLITDKLDTDLIKEVCSNEESSSTNKLVNAFLEKDKKELCKTLESINIYPLQAVYFMSGAANALLEGDTRSWKVRSLSNRAKQASRDDVEQLVRALAEVDIAVKSSSPEPLKEVFLRYL